MTDYTTLNRIMQPIYRRKSFKVYSKYTKNVLLSIIGAQFKANDRLREQVVELGIENNYLRRMNIKLKNRVEWLER